MKRLVVACALLVVFGVAGTLFCGCDSGDGGVVLPPELVGLWGAVAFDNAGQPTGGGLVRVLVNGDITADPDIGSAASSRAPIVIGHVTDENGTFEVEINDPEDGLRMATGDLNTDGTGAGVWSGGGDTGTFVLWKAQSGEAFTLCVTVDGPYTGTGTVSMDADGAISGTLTVTGVGTGNVGGVVTSGGHVVGGWGGSEGLPFVLLDGDLTETGASGTWTAEDGSTGTWTATFD